MYPIIRVLKEVLRAKRMPPLEALGAHVSYHRCWPHDLDVYLEMNNGRILSILDIGRTGLAQRVGLIGALKDNKWGMTMAGNSVRYRKRIRPFAKFRTVSRAVGWDEKFFYLEHSIWIGKNCAVQALFRAAVTLALLPSSPTLATTANHQQNQHGCRLGSMRTTRARGHQSLAEHTKILLMQEQSRGL